MFANEYYPLINYSLRYQYTGPQRGRDFDGGCTSRRNGVQEELRGARWSSHASEQRDLNPYVG